MTDAEMDFVANTIRSSVLYHALHTPIIGGAVVAILALICRFRLFLLSRRGGVI